MAGQIAIPNTVNTRVATELEIAERDAAKYPEKLNARLLKLSRLLALMEGAAQKTDEELDAEAQDAFYLPDVANKQVAVTKRRSELAQQREEMRVFVQQAKSWIAGYNKQTQGDIASLPGMVDTEVGKIQPTTNPLARMLAVKPVPPDLRNTESVPSSHMATGWDAVPLPIKAASGLAIDLMSTAGDFVQGAPAAGVFRFAEKARSAPLTPQDWQAIQSGKGIDRRYGVPKAQQADMGGVTQELQDWKRAGVGAVQSTFSSERPQFVDAISNVHQFYLDEARKEAFRLFSLKYASTGVSPEQVYMRPEDFVRTNKDPKLQQLNGELIANIDGLYKMAVQHDRGFGMTHPIVSQFALETLGDVGLGAGVGVVGRGVKTLADITGVTRAVKRGGAALLGRSNKLTESLSYNRAATVAGLEGEEELASMMRAATDVGTTASMYETKQAAAAINAVELPIWQRTGLTGRTTTIPIERAPTDVTAVAGKTTVPTKFTDQEVIDALVNEAHPHHLQIKRYTEDDPKWAAAHQDIIRRVKTHIRTQQDQYTSVAAQGLMYDADDAGNITQVPAGARYVPQRKLSFKSQKKLYAEIEASGLKNIENARQAVRNPTDTNAKALSALSDESKDFLLSMDPEHADDLTVGQKRAATSARMARKGSTLEMEPSASAQIRAETGLRVPAVGRAAELRELQAQGNIKLVNTRAVEEARSEVAAVDRGITETQEGLRVSLAAIDPEITKLEAALASAKNAPNPVAAAMGEGFGRSPEAVKQLQARFKQGQKRKDIERKIAELQSKTVVSDMGGLRAEMDALQREVNPYVKALNEFRSSNDLTVRSEVITGYRDWELKRQARLKELERKINTQRTAVVTPEMRDLQDQLYDLQEPATAVRNTPEPVSRDVMRAYEEAETKRAARVQQLTQQLEASKKIKAELQAQADIALKDLGIRKKLSEANKREQEEWLSQQLDFDRTKYTLITDPKTKAEMARVFGLEFGIKNVNDLGYVIVPHAVNERITAVLLPKIFIDPAARMSKPTEMGRALAWLGRSTIGMYRTGMTAFKMTATLLSGLPGAAYHTNNLVGALMLDGLAGGLAAANPKMQLNAIRMSVLAATNLDQDARALRFMLKDGTNTTIGSVMDIGQRHGLFSQGSLRYGGEHLSSNAITKTLHGAAKYSGAQKLNDVIENYQRATHWLRAVERYGLSPAGIAKAVDETAKYAGLYHRLSPVENMFIKEIVPFYAWQRTIFPIFARTFIENPQRLALFNRLQQTMNSAWGGETESAYMEPVTGFNASERSRFPGMVRLGPEFQPGGSRLQPDVWARTKPSVGQRTVARPQSPLDPLGLANPMFIESQMGPAVQAIATIMTGRNLATGRELDPELGAIWDRAASAKLEQQTSVLGALKTVSEETDKRPAAKALTSIVRRPGDNMLALAQILWDDGYKNEAVSLQFRAGLYNFLGPLGYGAAMASDKLLGTEITKEVIVPPFGLAGWGMTTLVPGAEAERRISDVEDAAQRKKP